jgi:tRNA pseudouridine55 synthase
MWDFQKGEILYFNKPLHWTSFDLVNKVRRQISRYANVPQIKTGHAGTLDPLATGVLILCTGRATKEIEELQAQPKEYVATIQLGATTPSFDKETPVDWEYPTAHITAQLVEQTLALFTGPIRQIPPAYSACRINGDRAYQLARKGREVALAPKLVQIDKIEILQYERDLLRIRVNCSKGTYIRSLARDIGKALGSGAYLDALERTRIGSITLDDCYTIEEWTARISPTDTPQANNK